MKFSVRIFSHHCEAKAFIAEASDLQEAFTGGPQITLVSDFGNEAKFKLNRVVRSTDEDNELLVWEYIPLAESVEHNPRLRDYTLTIFND